MSDLLEYKGYHAKVECNIEDEVLFGTVLGINDLITFEAKNIEDIKENFHEAVDDYLSICEKFNKEPEKEYTGCFNVRISPVLHKKLVLKAAEEGVSLNKIVEKLLQKGVEKEKKDNPFLRMISGVQENTQNFQYIFDNKKNLNTARYRERLQWQS